MIRTKQKTAERTRLLKLLDEIECDNEVPHVIRVKCAIAKDLVRKGKTTKKRVGRPPSGKIMVNLRLDPDVVAKFRATGPGWQARMNEALRKAMP